MKKSIKAVTVIMAVFMVALPIFIGCGGKKESASTSTEVAGTDIAKVAKKAGEKTSQIANDVSNAKASKPNPITDFEYDFNEDGETLYIKWYKGDSKTVVFPAEIEGMNVTKIGGAGSIGSDPVFSNYTSGKVEHVIIPEGVTEIAYKAFSNYEIKNNAITYHSNLKTVQLPSTLKIIREFAFVYCKELTSIQLPNGLETIEYGAFDYCKKLASIQLPNTLKEIRGFKGCDSLEKVVIPASVEKIGGDAFRNCKNLKEVVLYDTLTSIGGGAFLGCNSLTNINIPAGIQEIGNGAFEGTMLTNMTIPDSVQAIKFATDIMGNHEQFKGSQPPLLVRKKLKELGYTGEF